MKMMYQSLLITLLFNAAFKHTDAMKLVLDAKDATDDGGDCYEITSGTPNAVGGIWSEIEIDITQDFTISAEVYLGKKKSNKSQGIAFVIQAIGDHHANLWDNGRMGYANINSVVAVEMDTFFNGEGSGTGLNNYDDIASDHMQIRYTDNDNGWFLLSDVTDDPNTVAIGGDDVSIEDGNYHPFTVEYNAESNIMKVYFDNTLMMTRQLHEDGFAHYLTNYLGTDKMATVGFTASDNRSNNKQKVRFNEDSDICSGAACPIISYSDVFAAGGAKTLEPTSTNVIPGETSGVSGDPHFKTWDGKLYDFHGICDLVLLHNPDFEDGLSMDIHIRSKKILQWAYVSNIVIKISGDTFELSAANKNNQYWINGVLGEDDNLLDDTTLLPTTIAGYQIRYRSVNSQQKEYTINLGQGETITLKTWKHMVRIDLDGCSAENFASSVGLMGTFTHSHKVGRDNTTIIENLNQFGQEWQVLASEPKLFKTVEGPQAPSHCEIPSKTQLRRRLSESGVTAEEARRACESITKNQDFDLCVFDVMATGDAGVAGVY